MWIFLEIGSFLETCRVKIRVTSEDYIDSDGRMIQLVSQRGFLVLSIQIFSDLTSAWDQIKLVSIYS